MTPGDRKLLDDLRADRDAELAAEEEAAHRVAELTRLERLAEEEAVIEADRRREANRQAELQRLREISIPHPSGAALRININPQSGSADGFHPWRAVCSCGATLLTAGTETAAAGALAELLERHPEIDFRREPAPPTPAAEQSAPETNKKGKRAA